MQEVAELVKHRLDLAVGQQRGTPLRRRRHVAADQAEVRRTRVELLVHEADVCEVLAHVPVSRLNTRMHVALPEEEGYETVGGLVFHTFGRIPEVGERIESHGVALQVLAATRRRLDLIRVERLGGETTGGGANDGG